MKRIIVLVKNALESLPPIMTVSQVLADLGNDVIVVCSVANEETRSAFANRGIKIYEACPGCQISSSPMAKFFRWKRFARNAWRVIDSYDDNSLLWVGSADTALAMGKELFKRPFVFEILELYDRLKHYLVLMAPYARRARAVVVPEPCRAAIFRVWFKLGSTPFVLPNKTYGESLPRCMPVSNPDNAREMKRVANRKLVLYQSHYLRMEILDIARALKRLGEGYVLGTMGEIQDQRISTRLRREYPELVHFSYMPAPQHLEVTSHAYIGLLIYNYESLNNVFCAPNKIWEYSALALPMLCNELPMLSQQLAYYGAGETFRTGDLTSIEEAIGEIESRYADYCDGSARLFTSVSLHERVGHILSSVGVR